MAGDRTEGDQAAAAAGRLAVGGGEFVTGTAQDLLVSHGRGGAGQYAPERLLEEVVGWAGDRRECLPGSLGGAGGGQQQGIEPRPVGAGVEAGEVVGVGRGVA